MDKIEKVAHIISSRVTLVCAVISVGWVCVFAAYIISRFFEAGWLLVEEFTGYWLVLIAYMPLAYALLTDTHIRIEIVTSRLPEKVRGILEVCTDVIGLVFASYLLGRSVEWLVHGIEYGTVASASSYIILWPIYLVIPVGLALFVLVFMVKIARSVMELRRAIRA